MSIFVGVRMLPPSLQVQSNQSPLNLRPSNSIDIPRPPSSLHCLDAHFPHLAPSYFRAPGNHVISERPAIALLAPETAMVRDRRARDGTRTVARRGGLGDCFGGAGHLARWKQPDAGTCAVRGCRTFSGDAAIRWFGACEGEQESVPTINHEEISRAITWFHLSGSRGLNLDQYHRVPEIHGHRSERTGSIECH